MTSNLLDIAPLRENSLEARASTVLKVLAVINVAGMVLAMFPPLLPVSLLHSLTFNAAAGLLATLEVVEARALDRRRPWAVAVVRPLLVLVIAASLGSTLLGITMGRTRLPFEAAIAVWAFLARADLTLPRRADSRSLSLGAVTLALMVSMLFGQPIFGWGGLLEVGKADLRASIDAGCGEPGAGLPPTILVTYDWSWARTSPLPSGLDILVIGWAGKDAEGRQIYYFGKDLASGRGIHSGRRDYPSLDMAKEVEEGLPASWDWGVELSEQGLQPGRVQLQFSRAREAPPDPTPLVISATYVHLGLWRSDPVTVTCSW